MGAVERIVAGAKVAVKGVVRGITDFIAEPIGPFQAIDEIVEGVRTGIRVAFPNLDKALYSIKKKVEGA